MSGPARAHGCTPPPAGRSSTGSAGTGPARPPSPLVLGAEPHAELGELSAAQALMQQALRVARNDVERRHLTSASKEAMMLAKWVLAREAIVLILVLAIMVASPMAFGNDPADPLALALFGLAWVAARSLRMWVEQRKRPTR